MAKANANATTTSSCSSSNQSNMGLLLVFFPQDNKFHSTNSKSPTLKPTFSNNNNNNLILPKAQFTLSICALLFFITLLLFTLSTFEPSISNITPHPITKSKTRILLSPYPNTPLATHHALQRMGTLYRRGTRPMHDLTICHVEDEINEHDFRLFVRLIHRSGLTAKSDVVFLFSSRSISDSFARVIRQENNVFSSLVSFHEEFVKSESNFNLSLFYSNKKFEMAETVWGKRIRRNFSEVPGIEGGGGLLLSVGSVLSFDATELDPENSLGGFLERVPMSLRRWACYPMLLGRVRRNFKHVMLVDVKNMLILKDPFGSVRNRSPESVFLFTNKNSGKTRSKTQKRVNSGVVIGGARGVRRLCNAVVVEIVRAAMQCSKEKNSVSDSVILSELAGNEFMRKGSNNVNIIGSTESIPEASFLVGRNSGTATSLLHHSIIERGDDNNEISYVIKKQICSSIDSSVYRDC
ncbi:unnamed protein product [Lupinus luteus]|uniref:DUF7780 domain-containing protein n=1 Tax=Lupinus luteus TaxID=3873 RepID=A0AAV1XY54_LUPLU